MARTKPFEVTFGKAPQLGLHSMGPPDNAITDVHTEEELEHILAEGTGRSTAGLDVTEMGGKGAQTEKKHPDRVKQATPLLCCSICGEVVGGTDMMCKHCGDAVHSTCTNPPRIEVLLASFAAPSS